MNMSTWMAAVALSVAAGLAWAADPQETAMAERSLVSAGDSARLWRAMDKARRGQPVTVAVIGGSITQGAKATRPELRYGALVAAWWRRAFPVATITFVNAGIGATGSNFGAMRAQRDLLSKNPDVVVVEYAVNDAGTAQAAESLEGLVRQILVHPNRPAVLLLFMVNQKGGNAQDWFMKVGGHYRLPMVSYRDAVWPEIQAGRLAWTDISPDEVHPNDRGHAWAAEWVGRALQRARDRLPAAGALPEPPPVPAPRFSDLFERAALIEAEAMKPVVNEGWTYDTKTKAWTASKPGSVIEFEMEGRAIFSMHYVLRAAMGRARVTVDGAAPKILEAWFSGTWGGYRQTNELVRDLPAGRHRVRFELLPEKHDESGGHEFRILGLGAAGLADSSAAAPSEPAKVDLFEAGTGGFALFRIPGVVVAPKGAVLAYCEARRSDKSDWGPIDIVMRRSVDGGTTWTPPQAVVHVEGDLPMNPVAVAQKLDKPGENTANNPVAIVDRETGAVHFLYCLEYMRCFSMRSDDEGVTWTKPVEITPAFEAFRRDYDWKVLATGPGHGIQLERGPHKGRLVVPVWLSLGTGGHAHRPSVVATIVSDDHGATWRRGDIAVPDAPPVRWPNETAVVQLADGRVMLNARSESDAHRRIVVTSPDGATGWSAPRFDEALVEPICMGSLVRAEPAAAGGRPRIVFSNPANLARRDGREAPGKPRDRMNLTLRMSEDEGATWPFARRIEDGFSGYSDLAVASDGTILCFYERGSTDGVSIYRTGRLSVARIAPEWLAAGRTGTRPLMNTDGH